MRVSEHVHAFVYVFWRVCHDSETQCVHVSMPVRVCMLIQRVRFPISCVSLCVLCYSVHAPFLRAFCLGFSRVCFDMMKPD